MTIDFSEIVEFSTGPGAAGAGKEGVLGIMLAKTGPSAIPVEGNALQRNRMYRERAEELRAIAEDLKVEDNKRILLGLADSYEKMARGLECGTAQTPAATDER